MGKKFCPKCESGGVIADVYSTSIGLPTTYKCEKCGYSGLIFPEKTKIKSKK